MIIDVVGSEGKLICNGITYRCVVGRGGVCADKQEGDGATPEGTFPLRTVFYRADRLSAPITNMSVKVLAPKDGWSDDSHMSDYNTLVQLPYTGSHEKLWRDDHLYDIIVVIGYNDAPTIVGKGSAIFMHIAAEGYTSTDGCIALSQKDLLKVLSQLDSTTNITIH